MRTPRRGGFTLVELQAGMLAAAMVVLGCGMLLYVSLSSWRRSCADIELRRDASAAAELFAHALRAAAYTDVTAAVDTLTVPPVQFRRQQGALLYIPDLSQPGAFQTVVGNGLAAFDAAATDGVVGVHLRLTNASVATEFATTFTCRNQP